MAKITERNPDQSTVATWGSVIITPLDDVIVGSFATWTITYTVGAYAMDVGGGLKIGTRRQADFGEPQFEDPAADNYATVACSRSGSRVEAFFDKRGHKRPFNAVIVVRLAQGPLYPGDTITPRAVVREKVETKNGRWLVFDMTVENQEGLAVARGEAMAEFPIRDA